MDFNQKKKGKDSLPLNFSLSFTFTIYTQNSIVGSIYCCTPFTGLYNVVWFKSQAIFDDIKIWTYPHIKAGRPTLCLKHMCQNNGNLPANIVCLWVWVFWTLWPLTWAYSLLRATQEIMWRLSSTTMNSTFTIIVINVK